MAQLAELQVEAAREARFAAPSEYFSKVSSSFLKLHCNKLMGEEFIVQHPLLGGSTTLALPLVGKNQTLVAATAAQPLTPLFKLYEVVNIVLTSTPRWPRQACRRRRRPATGKRITTNC
jgi:hypothetical protein